MTKNPVEIRTWFALVHPDSGLSALFPQNGSVWSQATQEAMRAFINSLEQDVAAIVLTDTDAKAQSASTPKATPAGLGEHISGVNIPDM